MIYSHIARFFGILACSGEAGSPSKPHRPSKSGSGEVMRYASGANDQRGRNPQSPAYCSLDAGSLPPVWASMLTAPRWR